MFMMWSVIVWEFEGGCDGVDVGRENIVLLFVVGGDCLLSGNSVKLVCSSKRAYKSGKILVLSKKLCVLPLSSTAFRRVFFF